MENKKQNEAEMLAVKQNKVTDRTSAKEEIIRRPKMAIEQRAKQFMPFAAVTGLEKALREKEEEIEQNIK